VVLQFHLLRNERPELFANQLVNRLWYFRYGFEGIFSDISELKSWLELEVDGKQIEIPEDVAGLMVLNLPNYSGGVNLWGELPSPSNSDNSNNDADEIESNQKYHTHNNNSHHSHHSHNSDEDDEQLSYEEQTMEQQRQQHAENHNNEPRYHAQSIDDMMVEVVGITGSFHFGAIYSKLSSAIKIAQGRSLKFKTRRALPVQVDGEPWLQEACTIELSFFNQSRMVYKSGESCTIRTLQDSGSANSLGLSSKLSEDEVHHYNVLLMS